MTQNEHDDAIIQHLLKALEAALVKGLDRETNDQGEKECWRDCLSQVAEIGQTLTYVGQRS